MTAEILGKLFGSSGRVKVIRLFLLNPRLIFTKKEISRKCKIGNDIAGREISFLRNIGLIKNKAETIGNLIKLKNGKMKKTKKKIEGLGLNEFFPLLNPLKGLIADAVSVNKEKIIKLIKSSGNIKLIIFSGIFTQTEKSEIDLLVVGEAVRRPALENILSKIETDTGHEIIYGLLNTKEFFYRFSMNDRLVREILDHPHEKALNKLDI